MIKIYCTADQLYKLYPSLNPDEFNPLLNGTILLQNDSDGKGCYIARWTNSNPLPTQAQINAISLT